MTNKRRGLVLLLAMVMASGIMTAFSGCGKEDKKSETGTQTSAAVSVRSANTSTKFKVDETEAGDKAYKLEYNMVKNEYEGYQLLISSEKAIDSYYLTKADLKSGDKVISSENIEVYMQRYSTVTTGRDLTIYGAGEYPDALIPIDAAKSAGELKVEPGRNSALWINVYVPKETAAGVYTANFTLKVGEDTYDVPVSVTVNDYTLPDTVNARTSFSWRYNYMGIGEMDFSTDMMEKYYDFFLDYRISLENPVTDNPANDPVEFAQAIDKNWDRITDYTFMPLYGLGPSGNMAGGKWTTAEAQVLECAALSKPGRNLLEKGMFYFIDEPTLTDSTVMNDCLDKLTKLKNDLEATVKKIEEDTTGKFDTFKTIENWQETVLDIRNIIPMNIENLFKEMDAGNPNAFRFIELSNCYCPVWRNLSAPDWEEKTTILKEQYGITLWWYGCTDPNAPYATYHIADTNLLSARTINWLQMMYGIEGNLYWDACAYTYYWGAVLDLPCDLYEAPYRTLGEESAPAGDGFLTYPGKKYGLDEPIPSMRLMSIRDGNEEYEMLYALKAELAAMGASESDIQAEIERLCDSMYYNGSMLYADGENGMDFNMIRNELIQMLVEAKDGTNFYIKNIEEKGEYVDVTFCANAAEYDVYFGTTKLAASENVFNVILPVASNGFYDFKFVNKSTGATKIKTKYIAVGVYRLMDFNTLKDVPENIVLNEGDTCVINSDDNKTSAYNLKLNINSKITGDEIQDMIYTPGFKINTQSFGVSFEDVVYVHVDFYNLNADADNVTFLLRSGSKTRAYKTVALQPGLNSVDFVLKGTAFSEIASVDAIEFRFDNKGSVEANYVHKICIDNLYAVVKGE